MASARRSVEVVLANARAHHRYMREVMIAATYAAIGDKEETLLTGACLCFERW